MTKRKNIIRHKVDALGGKIIDFNSLDTGGAALTRRELAFIFWYTYPGSEAFMNAGRAAVRAGYKPKSSVMLGYRARRKPEIAAAITKILDERVGPGLRESLWCITWLCRIRMLFDVSDFYRPGKRIVKARGKETEINTYEIIPLDELSYEQRMCVDGIDYRGPEGIPVYKLPDRDKEFKRFAECTALLFPDVFEEPGFMKNVAICLKVKVKRGLKRTAAYLHGE